MPTTSTPSTRGRRIRRRPDNAVLDEVRGAFTKADAAQKRRPGRPTLMKTIAGATDYQVRRAIATLKTEQQATERPALRKLTEEQMPRKLVLTAPVSQSSPGPRQNGTRPATTTTPAPPSTTDSTTTPNPESTPGPAPGVKPPGDPTSPPHPPTNTSRHQPVRPPRSWPLALIGLAAAVAVWGGWVDLGRLTGFGMVQPLPGLVDGLRINTAIVLPIGIEAYGGYALRTWLSSATLSAKTRRYAGWSALASLVVGAGAQVASHLMKATGITVAPWGVTVVVSCVPVVVLGLATGLATLVRQDTAGARPSPTTASAPNTSPEHHPHDTHRAVRLATIKSWWTRTVRHAHQ